MFDEMSLEPGIDLDKGKDKINGFVHLTKKTNQFAGHALAFVVRGAIHKWQQPIAYYFCGGSTKKEEMAIILKIIITAIIDTGLIPVALVNDQGQSFQYALKSLQEDIRREQIRAGNRIGKMLIILLKPDLRAPLLRFVLQHQHMVSVIFFKGIFC